MGRELNPVEKWRKNQKDRLKKKKKEVDQRNKEDTQKEEQKHRSTKQ
jgi:hypothetical protein